MGEDPRHLGRHVDVRIVMANSSRNKLFRHLQECDSGTKRPKGSGFLPHARSGTNGLVDIDEIARGAVQDEDDERSPPKFETTNLHSAVPGSNYDVCEVFSPSGLLQWRRSLGYEAADRWTWL